MKRFKIIREKTLTPAEKKKREEIAKAMERDNPGMDKSKKMAIATATAKRVAENVKQKGKIIGFRDQYKSRAGAIDDGQRAMKKLGGISFSVYKATNGLWAYKVFGGSSTAKRVAESIEKMSSARLKYHATKKFPHGSFTDKEIKDEHKRRQKSEPNYHTVKPALESVEQVDEKSKGLWANIHAKRKRGEKPNPPGHPDRPTKADFERSQKKESTQLDEISQDTKDRYFQKSVSSHQHNAAVAKDAKSRGDQTAYDKARKNMKKRNIGMSRAMGQTKDTM